MRNARFRRASLSFGALMLGTALAREAAAQSRPNIILIVADDLGWAELGAYGQRRLATPSVDALAARGARFDAAYSTAPVCAPSRCSILTGLHAGHCAVDENEEPNMPLASRDPTFAELLTSVGYHGLMVGKWGLGGDRGDGVPWNTQSAPWRVGFSDVLAVLDQAEAQDHFPAWLWEVSASEGVPHVLELARNADGARGVYAPDLFAERAVELLATAEEPFVLYAATTLPHRELVAPEPFASRYEGLSEPEEAYAAMVERLDAHVGALVRAVEARGIADHTYFVVTSDNGPNAIDGHVLATFSSDGGLRGRKRDLYEGGIRVPLVVVGPGVPPTTIAEPVTLADLAPTFVELAGAPAAPRSDGRSLAPLFTTPAEDTERALYFACRERGQGSEPRTRDAVREGRWKWLRRADHREELYDLASDPGEQHDLAAGQPERVQAMARTAASLSAPPAPVQRPRIAVGVDDAWTTSSDVALGTPLFSIDPTLDAPFVARSPSPVHAIDVSVTEHGDARALRFDGERASRLVVGADPSLALGAATFTVEAVVRLEHLADAAVREERQWLLFEKPLQAHDDAACFGVLVQAGELGCEEPTTAPPHCSGRELAIVFGDALEDERHVVVARSGLRIEDTAAHTLAVRVDRTASVVEVELDGVRDAIPFFSQRPVESEAPLVVGARHDARGRFSQGLRGELFALHIAEGLVPTGGFEALDRLFSSTEQSIDLGLRAVASDGPPSWNIDVAQLAGPWAHWIELTFETERGLQFQGPTNTSLDRWIVASDQHARGTLRLDPAVLEADGFVDATLRVQARVGRTHAPVQGAPWVLRVRARRAPPASHPFRGLALGVGLVTLVTSLIAARSRMKRDTPARA